MLSKLFRLDVLQDLHSMAANKTSVESSSRETSCAETVLTLYVFVVLKSAFHSFLDFTCEHLLLINQVLPVRHQVVSSTIVAGVSKSSDALLSFSHVTIQLIVVLSARHINKASWLLLVHSLFGKRLVSIVMSLWHLTEALRSVNFAIFAALISKVLSSFDLDFSAFFNNMGSLVAVD